MNKFSKVIMKAFGFRVESWWRFKTRPIRFAWQRLTRGWDDRVIWSIDIHLAKVIPEWIGELARIEKRMGGVHGRFIDNGGADKQDFVYQEIIEGFECWYKMHETSDIFPNTPEWEDANEKFEKAFDLLKEYFGTLWY